VFLLFSTVLSGHFIEIKELRPGQHRYSSQNVEEKVEEAIRKGKVIFDSDTDRFIGKYASGKSLFRESEALPVIRACFGYVLVDGHHHVLMSLKMGVPEVPIKVVADLSQLIETEFWDEAERQGWAYLIDFSGQRRHPPREFCQLEDDPNRYFAALIARKYPNEKDLNFSKGAEYPLWIKLGKDIPFIEFMISDALWAKGLAYQYEMGRNPDPSFIEEARDILLKTDIPGLRLIKQRTHWSLVTENLLFSLEPKTDVVIQ
jgi:hypothetical protein